MATPPTSTATLNQDKYIRAARRMNPQPAKNTSLPFSSINLTRPGTEQKLLAARPALHPPLPLPLSSDLFRKSPAQMYQNGTNNLKENQDSKGKWGWGEDREKVITINVAQYIQGVGELKLLRRNVSLRKENIACDVCCCRMLFALVFCEWYRMHIQRGRDRRAKQKVITRHADQKGALAKAMFDLLLHPSAEEQGFVLDRCCDSTADRVMLAPLRTSQMHAARTDANLGVKPEWDYIWSAIFILTAARIGRVSHSIRWECALVCGDRFCEKQRLRRRAGKADQQSITHTFSFFFFFALGNIRSRVMFFFGTIEKWREPGIKPCFAVPHSSRFIGIRRMPTLLWQ